MTQPAVLPETVDGIVEVRRYGPAGARARVLFDVPHGATRDADFERWRAPLRSRLPDDLIAFFRVNTDFGAPEIAEETARRLGEDGIGSVVLRGLVPRTLVDLNRDLDGPADHGMTPGLPPWIRDTRDATLLREAWRRYAAAARRAHAAVCGTGGAAIAVHTYAPRSVGIDRVDDDIVEALRRAYRPDALPRWPMRPEVDVIVPRDEDGVTVDERWIEAASRALVERGFEVARSATYRLVPSTLAWNHARAHPGATACLEVRRDRIGAPWVPFETSTVDRDAVHRVATALAEATRRSLPTASTP